MWEARNKVMTATKIETSDMRWAVRMAKADESKTDEVLHFALKLDLTEYIWCGSGNATESLANAIMFFTHPYYLPCCPIS